MCSDISHGSCSVEFPMWRFATSCWVCWVCLSVNSFKTFCYWNIPLLYSCCWKPRQDHSKKPRHLLPHSVWTNLLPLENNVSFYTTALWPSSIKQMCSRIVAVHSVPGTAPYLSVRTWACGMTESHARSDFMYASLNSVWTRVVVS